MLTAGPLAVTLGWIGISMLVAGLTWAWLRFSWLRGPVAAVRTGACVGLTTMAAGLVAVALAVLLGAAGSA